MSTEQRMGVTVAQLIEYLQKQPQEALVAYACYSDQRLLNLDEIELAQGCFSRPDGWVQNARPDMPSTTYVLFPGN